jgi:hypothetical protein
VARRRGRGANAGLWKCSIDASSQSFFRQRKAKRLLLLGVSALPKQTLPTGIAARAWWERFGVNISSQTGQGLGSCWTRCRSRSWGRTAVP